jgi:nucleoside-triphosphatase THEP1
MVGRLRERGLRVGGFMTEEMREKGHRVGFLVRDIDDGPPAVMAYIESGPGPRVGRYRVRVPSFERVALPAIDQALAHADVLVLDELGRMELFSTPFVARLGEVFKAAIPLAATVQVAAHPITDGLKRRADVEQVVVTTTNRDDLPSRLVARLVGDGGATSSRG